MTRWLLRIGIVASAFALVFGAPLWIVAVCWAVGVGIWFTVEWMLSEPVDSIPRHDQECQCRVCQPQA